MLTQPKELDYWLSKFVLEVRKANGDCYPPETLHNMCSGLLRYIRQDRPEINIFKSPTFSGFQRALDGEMKRLRSTGLGVRKKQAEPITIDEENILWDKGILGCSTPQVLLDTMLFLCGLHFALRSGEEHRGLLLSQFELKCPPDGNDHLIYTENTSKNNQGGLLHRKVKPKVVTCYANKTNPDRCLVNLFKKYISVRPAMDSEVFYLTPLKNPKGNIWYSKVPVGHNTLSATVGRICKQGGLTGFKTNHSLRVTNATRLFQSGMDEQLIMSNTGHRSVDGVRSYKRIGEDQKKAISQVLNSATNGEHCSDENKPGDSKKPRLMTTPTNSTLSMCTSKTLNLTSPCPPSFRFDGCSSVTINYNINH